MSENEQALIIGSNIEKLLKANDMRQRDLASILGVSESTVGKWILGKAIPRMGKIQQLSDYFHIQKSEILNIQNEMPKSIINARDLPLCNDLNELCKALNAAGQKKAVEYVRFLLTDEANQKGFTDSNRVAG